ncbi:MAG: hypothetical protein SFV17_13355 [Candidatus Obscuribacter sp.]|nr:hypothetical protein [Candidatus Obscuribacter sp.]
MKVRSFDKAALALAILAIACAALHYFIQPYSSELTFDACHYLASSELIVRALSGQAADTNPLVSAHVSTGAFGPMTMGQQVAQAISIDGPLLPALGAMALILGKVLNASASATAVVICTQILLHGLNTYLVVLAARALLGGGYLGPLAGFLWALYPPALVAAGMFLTEPLAATLMLSITCLACRSKTLMGAASDLKKAPGTLALLGVLVGLVVLHKAALFPAGALAVALMFLPDGKRFKIAGVIALGLLSVVIGWFALTRSLSGEGSLMPNRVASENMSLGSDIENAGWHCMPLPPRTQFYFFTHPLTTYAVSFINNTPAMLLLETSKLDRLIAHPWNHYRRTVFGLDFTAQEVWQRLTLLLAALGIVAAGLRTSSKFKSDDGVVSSRNLAFALAIIVGHLLFLPFEGISRYFFSAMPLVTILAAYGASRLFLMGFGALPILIDMLICLLSSSWGASLMAPSLGYEKAALLGFVAGLLSFLLALHTFLRLDLRTLAANQTLSANQTLPQSDAASTASTASPISANRLTAAVLTGFLAAAFALVLSVKLLPAESPTRQFEQVLPAGQALELKVVLPAAAAKMPLPSPSYCGLLLDVPGALPEATFKVTVNGNVCSGFLPWNDMIKARPFHATLNSVSGTFARMSKREPHRWYYLPVSSELLHSGENRIELVCDKPLAVGAHFASERKRFLSPSLEYFSSSKFGEQEDGRPIDTVRRLAEPGTTNLDKTKDRRVHLYLLRAFAPAGVKPVDLSQCYYLLY